MSWGSFGEGTRAAGFGNARAGAPKPQQGTKPCRQRVEPVRPSHSAPRAGTRPYSQDSTTKVRAHGKRAALRQLRGQHGRAVVVRLQGAHGAAARGARWRTHSSWTKPPQVTTSCATVPATRPSASRSAAAACVPRMARNCGGERVVGPAPTPMNRGRSERVCEGGGVGLGVCAARRAGVGCRGQARNAAKVRYAWINPHGRRGLATRRASGCARCCRSA